MPNASTIRDNYGINRAIGSRDNGQWFPLSTFDGALCGVIIGGSAIDYGGTTFDCYEVAEYEVGTMPTAGTSFDHVQNGNNLYYLTLSETFDGYADGALAEQAATNPVIFGNIYVG